MAKLYAQITSDKGGRVVGKGGEDYITIQLNNGNLRIFDITFKNDKNNRGEVTVMSYLGGSDSTTVIPYDWIPF
jgi:hypothetical protein